MNFILKEIDSNYDKELLKLFEQCTDYFELVEGEVPKDTNDFFLSFPPSNSIEDKINLGLFKEDTLIGAVDIIKDYPEEKEWIIGLMIIDKDYRKAGLGRYVHDLIKTMAKNLGAKKLRIGVAEQNLSALEFWKTLGYKEIKITEPMKIGIKESRVIVMNYLL